MRNDELTVWYGMCIGLERKRKWESDSFPFKLIKSKSDDKYMQGCL